MTRRLSLCVLAVLAFVLTTSLGGNPVRAAAWPI
jgi:hypothetical protein